MAELVVVVAWLGVAPIAGDVRRRPWVWFGRGRGTEGEREQGVSEGGGQSVVGGGPPYLLTERQESERGGPGRRMTRDDDTAV